jgi:hypothetical protein
MMQPQAPSKLTVAAQIRLQVWRHKFCRFGLERVAMFVLEQLDAEGGMNPVRTT